MVAKGVVALGLVAGLIVALAGTRQEEAKSKREHTILTPGDLKWGEGPEALPAGAMSVPLDGDPKKEEVFHLRIKFPAGYKIPPHWHPVTERITIISGTGKLGLGEKFDETKMKTLTPGSFVSLPPKTAHYVVTEEETVVQLSTMGPWRITYVDPADDPRLKAK
jgi:quercetin dioxygenase-like cupin family protein